MAASGVLSLRLVFLMQEGVTRALLLSRTGFVRRAAVVGMAVWLIVLVSTFPLSAPCTDANAVIGVNKDMMIPDKFHEMQRKPSHSRTRIRFREKEEEKKRVEPAVLLLRRRRMKARAGDWE